MLSLSLRMHTLRSSLPLWIIITQPHTRTCIRAHTQLRLLLLMAHPSRRRRRARVAGRRRRGGRHRRLRGRQRGPEAVQRVRGDDSGGRLRGRRRHGAVRRGAGGPLQVLLVLVLVLVRHRLLPRPRVVRSHGLLLLLLLLLPLLLLVVVGQRHECAADEPRHRPRLGPQEQHHALPPVSHRHVHAQVARRVVRAAQAAAHTLAGRLPDDGGERDVECACVVRVQVRPERPVGPDGCWVRSMVWIDRVDWALRIT